jgi:hypothetical protein
MTPGCLQDRQSGKPNERPDDEGPLTERPFDFKLCRCVDQPQPVLLPQLEHV